MGERGWIEKARKEGNFELKQDQENEICRGAVIVRGSKQRGLDE